MVDGTTWISHLRMQFGGTLGDPVSEQWSNTLKWHVDAAPTAAAQLAAANAVVPALKSWFGGPAAQIHRFAKVTWVKLNYILATGAQADTNTVIVDFSPQAGNLNVQTPPFYQTAALTLRTDLQRGRTHVGRIYPPLVCMQNPDQGTPYGLSTTAATDMAASFATFLADAKAAMTPALGGGAVGVPIPGIFSPGVQSKLTVPRWQRITRVVVDRVPDVQHRRTNGVPRSEGNPATVA